MSVCGNFKPALRLAVKLFNVTMPPFKKYWRITNFNVTMVKPVTCFELRKKWTAQLKTCTGVWNRHKMSGKEDRLFCNHSPRSIKRSLFCSCNHVYHWCCNMLEDLMYLNACIWCGLLEEVQDEINFIHHRLTQTLSLDSFSGEVRVDQFLAPCVVQARVKHG
jgi:hypothetical protein